MKQEAALQEAEEEPEIEVEPEIEEEPEIEVEPEVEVQSEIEEEIDEDEEYQWEEGEWETGETEAEIADQSPLDYLLAEQEEQQTEELEKPKKKGLFSKLLDGLTKTRDNILGGVEDVLKSFKKIDEELYEELEEVLIMADFGVETTQRIMDNLREIVKERKIVDPEELKGALQEIITEILTSQVNTPIIVDDRPNVVLIIGVNGAGKTTSIGKLSHQLTSDGKKVVLAAADTFRAAAIEQLQIWADRANVDLIKQAEGSDPASVVFDAIASAKSKNADVLICDTAGRLQNKVNLMKELEKISRVIEREYPEAHKEVLIVLDATTGQNAISQVKVFKEAANVDGIILTKLDGTAKGGAVVGICSSLNVPVKYIGVGETIDDLQVFDPESFARALFQTTETSEE
ncbi:MAG: signal recognition particle-docking protein FtsY [Epulopiscium sp. Nele67-Bin004]|nr:MAG: signal recognition particle-docking protein FtsY [Epulopiscium sp. Nele67-Bin004]